MFLIEIDFKKWFISKFTNLTPISLFFIITFLKNLFVFKLWMVGLICLTQSTK